MGLTALAAKAAAVLAIALVTHAHGAAGVTNVPPPTPHVAVAVRRAQDGALD